MRKFQFEAMANEVSKSEDVGDGGVVPSIFRVITIPKPRGRVLHCYIILEFRCWNHTVRVSDIKQEWEWE